MTITDLLDGKTITRAMQISVGGVVALAALYLVGWVMTGGLQDISVDIQTVKAQHEHMATKIQDMQEELTREARKQTIIQQKNCIRLSTTKREADDCLIFEP